MTPQERFAESMKLWDAYLALGGSLNRSPILTALSSMRKSGVRTLLMGGQACVFYGAAEFSRDLDLLVLADPENLARLRRGLSDLEAKPVAIPELRAEYLQRGHEVSIRDLVAAKRRNVIRTGR